MIKFSLNDYLDLINNHYEFPKRFNATPATLQFHEQKNFKFNVKKSFEAFHRWQVDRLKKSQTLENALSVIDTLIAERTLMVDTLIQLWIEAEQVNNYHAEIESLAVIAVGGYGRGQLLPFSDIDIFIIKQTSEVTSYQAFIISQLTQFLWDVGLIPSIQTASMAELFELLKADINLYTSTLSARYLIGNIALYDALVSAVYDNKMLWTLEAFYYSKLEDKVQRHQVYESTGYHLEPDIKHNPGGLRDIHLINWLFTKIYPHNKDLTPLTENGILSQNEMALIHSSERLLLLYRFVLHSIVPRQEDRLLFMHQLTLIEHYPFFDLTTQDLALTNKRMIVASKVESMMKCFYKTTSNTNILIEIILDIIKNIIFKPPTIKIVQSIDEDFDLLMHKPPTSIGLPSKLVINLKDNKPITAIRLFQLFLHLATYRLPFDAISQDLMRKINHYKGSIDHQMSDDQTLNAKFIEILMHTDAIKYALEPMHKLGILARYMSDWDHIEGLMQFDRFHAYTVDEHIIQVLKQIDEIKIDVNFKLAHKVYHQLSNPAIVTISAFFHDLGKGRGGDHAVIGEQIFYRFAKQHALDNKVTAMIGWLIKHHLLLSITAQRRDISDPDIIKSFADEVQTQQRLDALLILTIADIKGTNHNLWNDWKQSLIEQLYLQTKDYLLKPQKLRFNWRSQIKLAKATALELLTQRFENFLIQKSHLDLASLAAPKESLCVKRGLEMFWKRCRVDYFLYHDANKLAWHAEVLLIEDTNYFFQPHYDNINLLTILPKASIHLSNEFEHGGTELFIWCQDRPKLFAAIVNLIDRRNLSILQAQIFTNRDDMAMDSFIIAERNGNKLSNSRQNLIKKELLKLVSDPNLCVPNRKTYMQPETYFNHITDIKYLSYDNPNRTYIEINTLDKKGLLASITSVFAELDLNVIGARISTVGERIEDMFILTCQNRVGLDEDLKNRLKDRLIQVIDQA